MTAAIYAARSNLCPLVIAPAMGGQLMAKGVRKPRIPAKQAFSRRVHACSKDFKICFKAGKVSFELVFLGRCGELPRTAPREWRRDVARFGH